MTALTAAPLSWAMRDGSRREHRAAEGSHFVTALLAGRVDGASYAAYLRRLRTVYASIETAGRANSADPCVVAVLDPALERLDALDADLAFWSPGSAVEGDSPVADLYAQRVRDSALWGGLFVAHHYTRYLGDLSGGRAIRRSLARTFDLDENGNGLAFYAFPQIPEPQGYKDAYRARLDLLGLDAGPMSRIVAEVKHAFELNRALFAELDEAMTPAAG
jgi:heme oxygenase